MTPEQEWIQKLLKVHLYTEIALCIVMLYIEYEKIHGVVIREILN